MYSTVSAVLKVEMVDGWGWFGPATSGTRAVFVQYCLLTGASTIKYHCTDWSYSAGQAVGLGRVSMHGRGDSATSAYLIEISDM